MQRRSFLTVLMLMISVLLFAQPAKKTRNIAKTDDASVAARKISVRYTEGIKAYHTGNYAEALRIFNGIILDNPKHDPSYFMLSMVHTSQNNPQEAIHNLQQALKIDKSNVWYKVDLADLYMQTENYAAAAKLWEQICKEKDNNEYYLYSLSQAYVNLNKLDKVLDTYNRMETLMGHNDEITRAKVAIWLYQNKVKEAVGEYEKLIKIYPHNADFYVKAGDIYQSNDMLTQAMSYYEKAAAMNANDPNLNMTLANYYSKKGDENKQNYYLMKVFANPSVEIAEKTPFLSRIIAGTLRDPKQSNIALAEQLSDTLIKVHPESAEGYQFKATMLTVQKKYAQALGFYEKSFSIDNTNFSAWNDYCYVLNQLDQWNRILTYEKDLLELFPTNAIMLCNLGLGYLYANNADKAIEYLKQSLTFTYEKEQKKVIYSALSEAYKMKGDAESAAQWKSKAERL